MIATDWGQVQAAGIIGDYLRRHHKPATRAEQDAIAITSDLAGLAIAMGVKIQGCGASLETAALHAKVISRLARCLKVLGEPNLGFLLSDGEAIAQTLLALTEAEGEA